MILKTCKKGYRMNKIPNTSQKQDESTSLITYVCNIMPVRALLTQNLERLVVIACTKPVFTFAMF